MFYESSTFLDPDCVTTSAFGKIPKGILLWICGEDIKANEIETIKGIENDNKLKFGRNPKILCTKASQKLAAFQKISNLIDTLHKK